MSTEPLISIITPVKDAKPYLEQTHQSILDQTWSNWEWIICDNGSGDGSFELLKTFSDTRIQLYSETKPGVCRARNKCLEHAKGKFICMLDADDILPTNSLKARADFLQNNPKYQLCDGEVEYCDQTMSKVLRKWAPSFEGNPTEELLNIRNNCFFGNTWMMYRDPDARFDNDLRHSEDLMFFLSQSRDKLYSSVNEPILKYRTGHFHAMSDSRGIEAGYRHVAAKLPIMGFSRKQVDLFRAAAERICFRSALKEWRIIHAMKLRVAGL